MSSMVRRVRADAGRVVGPEPRALRRCRLGAVAWSSVEPWRTRPCIPGGTVVVGVDGSPSCDRALDWAVDHARARSAATGPRSTARAVLIDRRGRPVESTTRRALRARLLARARRTSRELAPDLAVNEALWPVDPQVVLLELARAGRGGRRRLARPRDRCASAAARLGRRSPSPGSAPCPVVVVRPDHPGVVRHGVVVGVDAGERCRPVLEFAYRQASLRDLPLTILHGTGQGEEPRRRPGRRPGEAVAAMAEKFPDVGPGPRSSVTAPPTCGAGGDVASGRT